jgi:hypothetical protein
MSLATAGLAGVLVLAATWRRLGADRVAVVVRLAAPAALATGWFYLSNIRRYGDPTGSGALFDRFSMQPRMGLLPALGRSRTFADPIAFLLREIDSVEPHFLYSGYFYRAGPSGVLIALAVLAALTAAVGTGVAGGARRLADRRWATARAAWPVAAALAAVPVVLLAQHWAGGGAAHPRYLVATLPVLAVAVAFVAAQIRRWLAAGVAVAAVAFHLVRLPAAGQVRLDHRFVWGQWGSVVGAPWTTMTLASAILAGILLVVAVVAATRSRPA